jgi:hypothetical protein
MQFVQKIWPHIVVAGSSILFQHTGQVKIGSFGVTFAGSLLVFADLFDCHERKHPVKVQHKLQGNMLAGAKYRDCMYRVASSGGNIV